MANKKVATRKGSYPGFANESTNALSTSVYKKEI